ncbi:MAG: ectonucleotide pyrophosphatase/phosphodiesterase [Chthonomonadales bacterium]
MKPISRLTVLLLVFIISGFRIAEAQSPALTTHVVIISIDGGKASLLRNGHLPNLDRLVQEGAVTWAAQTVLPSVTLTSHTSMLTGRTPREHKMIWDDWEPSKGYVKVPTIFQLAQPAHLSSMMIVAKKKLQHIAPPGSVGEFIIAGDMDFQVARKAAEVIQKGPPNLLFIHLPDMDGYGHKYGWGSKEQIESMHGTDKALGTIFAAMEKKGLYKTSIIIVSADHGGHSHKHGSSSPEDMTIPWIIHGPGLKPGFKISAPVNTIDTAATALYVLGVKLPTDWTAKPVLSAFGR